MILSLKNVAENSSPSQQTGKRDVSPKAVFSARLVRQEVMVRESP
jgi:hypothetical protein